MARSLVAWIVLAVVGAGPGALGANWPCIGADPGLSKYSPDNIPANGALHLLYTKRFYGKYTADRGNFFYGSSVVTHGGKAIIIADDRLDPPASSSVSFLAFDWQSGQAQGYYTSPWPLWQNDHEVDSHHYTNPIIWHSDGRVYMRRGGDNASTQVFLPASGQLIQLYNRDAQGIIQANGIDATALMQVYKDLLIYRYGHTFLTKAYDACSISEACFVAPNQEAGQPDVLGTRRNEVGPSVPAAPGADGLSGSTGRYGDIPKCANDICVMAGLAYNNAAAWPDNMKVWLEATDLVTAQTLWTRTWNSDAGGQQGLGTSISDYWRFVATDSGHYIFFTRAGLQPVTVRAVDLRTGDQKWSKGLTDPQERPVLACHAGWLYVIGRADQYKLNVNTGEEAWHTTYSWPHDQGYVLGNHDLGSTGAPSKDPLYRPVVLTDDTLWFVDGDGTSGTYTPTAATLVAIRTSDGQVVQQIDLRGYYSGRPNESLLVVNDVMVADGLLGVLLGVRSAQSPYPNTNGMDYQDLCVFQTVRTGDINRDGRVDSLDLLLLTAAWNSRSTDRGYKSACDLNNDGVVDIVDLLILADNWDW